jgi:diphosphomevalonate decarboxylase
VYEDLTYYFDTLYVLLFQMISTRSTPNIALIKYWGNRNDKLRLPAADSLSMTLDSPTIEVHAGPAEEISVTSFDANGTATVLEKKHAERFEKHLKLCNAYLGNAIRDSVQLEIRSHVPRSVGIASSAAVFSAIAKAYAASTNDPLSEEQISILARLGSGSAARSVLGGFVALENNESDEIDGAIARQIADENHWLLHDIILIPTQIEKQVGSSEGHAIAFTSPHYKKRILDIEKRQEECIDAILKRDFENLQRVSEEDCWDMHNVMSTSKPSLQYLSDETYRITDEIEELRDTEHLEVLYTMDAGPTVHCICTEGARSKVLAYAKEQKECQIIEAKVGGGAVLIEGQGACMKG